MPGQKRDDMNTHFAPAAAAPIASEEATPGTLPAQSSVSTGDAVSDPVRDGGQPRWWRSFRGATARAVAWVRSLGPYVAIELILPGGTLIALALWTYRRRRAAQARATVAASAPVTPAASARLLPGLTPCTQR